MPLPQSFATSCHVVLITAPSENEAHLLAKGLVENRLAACVNIVPGITSFYWWKGKVNQDAEYLLICKTTEKTWPQLRDWVVTHHSYTVPEVIALPILAGSDAYMAWLADAVPGQQL